MKNYIMNVNFDKKTIYTNLQKLVRNDYNSAKINFTFDKEGRVLFKMLYPNGEPYVTQIENNELILTKGILNQAGKYEIEIALYTDDSRMTDYMTASFSVRKELVEIDEVIEGDNRLPILDALIVEINGTKLYLDEVKKQVENGEFNGKDGETPTIGENGNWFIRGEDTGLPSQGERGKDGSVKFIVVTELPTENVDESAIYMKPSADAQEKNIYEEYIYVNGTWESLGTGIVDVDLTNYSTKEEVKVITGELKNLLTENKSNLVNAINEVASSGGGTVGNGKIAVYKTSFNYLTNYYNYSSSPTNKELGNLLVELTENATQPAILMLVNKMDWGIFEVHKGGTSNNDDKYALKGMRCYFQSSLNYSTFSFMTLDLHVNPTTNTITKYSSANNVDLDPREILTTTNTTSYTPTSDYHPANKKYVDDAIASAITTVLAGEY